MNPLILIGLGAVALLAMGKKKPKPNGASEKGDAPSGTTTITPRAARHAAIGGVGAGDLPVAPPPSDYSAQISSKGQDLALQCINQGHNEEMGLTMCIAKKLFPTWNWNNRSGWMLDAWSRMRNVARVKLGKDPIIT